MLKAQDLQGASNVRLCITYDALSKQEKSSVLQKVQEITGLPKIKIQKHYANSYRRCIFVKSSDALKKVICMMMWRIFHSGGAHSKPLKIVQDFLKNNNIIRFPSAVHADTSKAWRELDEGVYTGPSYDETEMQKQLNSVKEEGNLIPELRPREQDSPSAREVLSVLALQDPPNNGASNDASYNDDDLLFMLNDDLYTDDEYSM